MEMLNGYSYERVGCMSGIKTEAWVLISKENRRSASFQKKEITIRDTGSDEVLVKPLYSCLEGNYIHALKLKPESIFDRRNEDEVVLGNSGVVKVVKIGNHVKSVKLGDICLMFSNGVQDEVGYPKLITAYDKPNTIGVFAKTINLRENELIKIPENSKHSPQAWAAFSLKYITAWSNWNVAYKCWKSQMAEVDPKDTYVFGWGGGVTFAQLTLAKLYGCKCYMMSSREERLQLLEAYGITGIDRTKYSSEELLELIRDETNGRGVSIFIDYIGEPMLYKLTMKALGRQGVITTAGWKEGSLLPVLRAQECQQRHIHVFTHYARYQEGAEAVKYAEEKDWLPPLSNEEYKWEDLSELLHDYSQNKISSWFPVFKINDERDI